MSNTRKLWLLTIFSCVTLVSAGAFADPTYTVTPNHDYSGGRRIVASKAYVDSKVDSAYEVLDNAKQNKQIGAVGTVQNPSEDANKPVIVGVDGKITMGSGPLASVATSGSYNDLTNTPTVPTVYEGTLDTNISTAEDDDTDLARGNPGAWRADAGTKVMDAKSIKTALDRKQNLIDAGTNGNILTYSGTAGTLGTPLVKSANIDGVTGGANSDDAKIPTVGAVEAFAQDKSKLNAQGNSNVSTLSANDDTVYPTSKNVASYVAGEIAGLEAASHSHTNGAYISYDSNDGSFDLDAVTSINASNSADDAKIPTVGAVEGYAQKKIDAGTNGNILTYSGTAGTLGTPLVTSGSIDGTASSSDDAKIPTVGAVEDYVVSQTSTANANSHTHADSGTHISIATNGTQKTINVSGTTNVGSGVTASSTDLTEGKAVYEFAQKKPDSVADGKILTYGGTDANANVVAKYVHVPVTLNGDPSATNNPASVSDMASIWVQ